MWSRVVLAIALGVTVFAGGAQPSAAAASRCRGVRLSVHRRSRHSRARCVRLDFGKLLAAPGAADPILTSAKQLAAALPRHGGLALRRKTILKLAKILQARTQLLAAPASSSSLASASIAGVGRSESKSANSEDDGAKMTGTVTDLYPDDSHAGTGQVADMKVSKDGVEITTHTEGAAFLPRCPGGDGKSSGPVTLDARVVVRSGGEVIQSTMHMAGTVTVQFDQEGHYQSTSFDVSFGSVNTARGAGGSYDKEVDGRVEEQIDADGTASGEVSASIHGSASEGEAQAAVRQYVNQVIKTTAAARDGVRKAVEGGALKLTFTGQGTFDLEDEGGGGESRGHDDLAWTAEYELNREVEKLEPVGPGALTAGPGNFSFRWPEYQVSCAGPLADGPQLPEIVPAGGVGVQRFELKPIDELRDESGLVNYLGCQGEISGLPFDGSGEAADQTAGALNPSLPDALEVNLEIPDAAAKAGSYATHVTEADGQGHLPSSCDDQFGTQPGECTMSLHYTGTITLAPRSCVASVNAIPRPYRDRLGAAARRHRGGAGEL
jgi:hypothetical protein